MNIVSNIYNYFIACHPIAILSCCILAYFLLSIYIFNLGKVLSDTDKLNKGEAIHVTTAPTTDWWLENNPCPKIQRRDTQTKKTTPHRYQKGKYKNMLQGIRRGKLKLPRKGRPQRKHNPKYQRKKT